MVSQEWQKRWSRLRIVIRDMTLGLSGTGFVLGLFMVVVGALSFWFQETLPEDWRLFLRGSSRVDVCVGGVGLLLLIIAGYYFVDNIYKRIKFHRLINTTSRQKLVMNREKLEELAWELSSRHERMVQRKLREMKIR
ncbi:MAG: DUF3198 domain-containing protein [Thermoplasmata archaeon]